MSSIQGAGPASGRTVFVAGADRGRDRSHAVTHGRESAAIAAPDIADQIMSVSDPMPSRSDPAEEEGRNRLSTVADVREIHGTTVDQAHRVTGIDLPDDAA